MIEMSQAFSMYLIRPEFADTYVSRDTFAVELLKRGVSSRRGGPLLRRTRVFLRACLRPRAAEHVENLRGRRDVRRDVAAR